MRSPGAIGPRVGFPLLEVPDGGTRTRILPITNRALFDPGRSFQFSYVRSLPEMLTRRGIIGGLGVENRGFPTDGDVAAMAAELAKCSAWHPKNPEEFCRRLLDAVRVARGLPGPEDMTMEKLMAASCGEAPTV